MNKKLTLKNANIAIEDGNITIEFDENDLIEETSDICTSNDNNQVKLRELKPGDEFYIGSSVYVVVDHIDDTTKVISKKIAHIMAFNYENCCNDYYTSDIHKRLNNYDYSYMINHVGKDNIVPTQCDMGAIDGSGSHGTSEENITILSLNEYCKYYDILHAIPNFTSQPQWLSNPVSMISKAKAFVCAIDRDGLIEYINSSVQDVGVRQFFTLKSSTEVKPCELKAYGDNNAETN